MANFLSCARGPHLRAESKFVKLDLYEQVDFCPFRGPDAPFALRRFYHDKEAARVDVKDGASESRDVQCRGHVKQILAAIATCAVESPHAAVYG
jgi:hypothetical protein